MENIVYNERYSENDFGVILVNLTSKDTNEYTIKFSNIPDGEYYDTLSGRTVTIKHGKSKISFDDTGIMVLTLTETVARPRINIDKNSCMFADKIDVKIEAINASEATYQINNETPISFNGSQIITIGEDVEANEVVNLTVTVKNGDFSKTRKMSYTKLYLYEGYVNILNLNQSYLTDYELYIWAWGSDYNPGRWLKNYEVREDRLLVDFADKKVDGFLLAIFPKDYIVSNLNAWDSKVIKQSSDIKSTDNFFDASSF